MRAARSSTPASSESLTIRTQAENIAAQVVLTGRPPLEADSDSVSLLLAALREGNYREAACAEAGISKQSLYRALKRAEAGNDAAIAFRDAVENAESAAEAGIVKSWRKAIDAGPQYWAAAATFLERKNPEKWGRRQDEGNTPKVVVQIGVNAADVSVNVTTSDAHQGSITDAATSRIELSAVDTVS